MFQKSIKSVFKYIFISFLIIMIFLVWYNFLRHYISYDFLLKNHNILLSWKNDNYYFTLSIFIVFYILVVALSVPGASIMSITGGFLFATFPGVFFNVLGAVIGATIIFIGAKIFFSDSLLNKIKNKYSEDNFLTKMQSELQENEFNYLIILRLIPIIPFFITNLALAIFGVRLRIFIITTLIGILPVTFVYTSFGAGLSSIFKNADIPSINIFANPIILVSSVFLIILAVLPIIIKKIKKAN
jgi:uncharacterized membrane protein YdjX (TVP38/TMEM64 family)